ncbi:hypothetical protein NE237_014067 [Protea cynaroides]|uniref:Plastocyanin-like domain-containing protein n=1 Tax=Protea cynaroides TaxID=273540 RepID=A0A9Q0H151_9MAGN|nr:hypothetical protein NE237_014067 [Protea cynaroides]
MNCDEQAWHPTTKSGWTDRPAYVTQCPDSNRAILCVQLHHYWSKREIVLACPYLLAKESGGMQILRLLSTKLCKQEQLLMNPMPTLSAVSLDLCTTAPPKVKPGKTYLLRLINAALNDELFFRIANHSLTVVEVDAVYVKPFKTDTILITRGQTTNVLLKTYKHHFPGATFFMSSRSYATGIAAFNNSTTSAILQYNLQILQLLQRLGLRPCPKTRTCLGPNGTMLAASINNVSFAQSNMALLQAHIFRQSRGVYTTEFPVNPLLPFNYTGNHPATLW